MPYRNHPFERDFINEIQSQSPNSRRSLLTEAETAPIRISAYYDPDSITLARTDEQISRVKSVIGAVVNYYENAIRVIPIDGTFYMRRFCNAWYDPRSPDYGVNCISYSQSLGAYTCQNAIVPDDHFSEQW